MFDTGLLLHIKNRDLLLPFPIHRSGEIQRGEIELGK
jgi:hypothetical protein